LETGQIVGLANHTKLTSRDGNEYQISDSGSPIKDDQGRMRGVILVFRDITKNYYMQEQLQETKKQLERAQEIGKIGSWQFDLNSRKVIASKEAYRIYGLNPSEHLTIEKVQKIPLSKDRHKLDEKLTGLIKGENEYDVVFKLQRASDQQILTVRSVAEYDPQKNIVTGIIQDISDIKAKEEELAANYQLLHIAGKSAKFGGWSSDLRTNELKWSPEAARIHEVPEGFSPSQEDAINYVAPEWRERVWEMYRACAEEGTPFDEELEIITGKGNRLWVRNSGEALKDEYGNIIKIQGAVQDINKQKQAEEELRKSEERWQFALEGAGDGVWDWNLKTNEVFFSRQWKNMLGYNEEEISSNLDEWKKRIHPADKEKAMEDLDKHLQGETNVYTHEQRLLCKDGSYKWILNRSKVFSHDSEGQPLRMIGTHSDIHEKKINELELKKTRFGIDKAQLGIYQVDEKGIIHYANDHACESLGYNKDELIGISIFNIDPNFTPETFKHHRSRVKEKQSATITSTNRRKDGSEFPVEVTVTYFEYQGELLSYSFVKDITERENMIKELKDAKEKAEESDRLKSAFLANMSHEIRTPMNGILGFIDLLQDTALSEEQREHYISIVKKGGNRLLDTINDIIEISKLEAGQVSLHKTTVDLPEVLGYFHDFYKKQADENGLDFRVNNTLEGKADKIITDKTKLESILGNLIKNAFKFTTQGFIEMGCQLENDEIVFYVMDSGIGIPQDRLNAIFERFMQADLDITRPHEGSGLGLSIAKGYTEMLGGRIWVVSEEEKGSTFYVAIPYQPTQKNVDNEAAYQESNDVNGHNKTILVVEDEEYSYVFLQIILSNYNFNVIRARHGAEAVNIFEKNQYINLVLMDLKMPVMDGYEATRQIRKIDKQIPIIAQTAYAMEGDQKKALDAGCDEYIIKPVKKENLMQVINKTLVKTR
ncbi:MAG: PAS domain S-box protein, partial [Bacteroidales bacterium]|nr:PAS domain S-box protein [Bacteroidales bacterium]